MDEQQTEQEVYKPFVDPSWEKQQKKTFTAWCNSHLRKRKIEITDICQDFRTGLKLMALLEIISGERLPKPDSGKMRFHHVNNCNKALNFITEKGVKLAGTGAEEIVDGNLKMTLGMIWTVILRFSIQDISVEEMSAKEGLLLWCKKKTANHKNVNVRDFHMSWKDGLAFCALIHRHRPELIDYDSLSKNDPMTNLNTAFDIADKHLDIPRMLDPEDLVNNVKPDERAVMTYVACYYHAFSGAQKAEQAGNRICKALSANQENEKLMDEYEKLASDLLEWIEQKRPTLEDRASDNTMEGLQQKLEDFGDYRKNQKPPKSDEKGQLESVYNTLQTKLRLSNRPPYTPAAGKLVSDIAKAWSQLEGAEKGYEEWLLSERRRLESLDHLAKKFHLRVRAHKMWNEGKHETATSNDYQDCNLQECKAYVKKHEAFESDYVAHQERVDQIEQIAAELNTPDYYDAANIASITEDVKGDWGHLGEEMQSRAAALKAKEEELEALEGHRLEYAKRAGKLYNWMRSSMEDMEDTFQLNSVDEAQGLIAEHQNFLASIGDAEVEKDKVIAYTGFAADKETGNQYTSISPNDIETSWTRLVEVSKQRTEDLDNELKTQQENEELRKTFANLANEFGPWMRKQYDECREISAQASKSLDQVLQQLKVHMQNIEEQSNQEAMDKIESVHQSIVVARIYDNPYTAYQMDHIRSEWNHLRTTCGRTINEVDNQILLRDARGITEEQIKDFRASFDHFDKDKSGRLDVNEFRACLISLGHEVDPNIPEDVVRFDTIMKQVDPNNDGNVTFEAYMDFMARDIGEEDSARQVTDSFRVLAGDKPYIMPDEIKRELPPDQAEYCISRMSNYTGSGAPEGALDYESFSSGLYGESEL